MLFRNKFKLNVATDSKRQRFSKPLSLWWQFIGWVTIIVLALLTFNLVKSHYETWRSLANDNGLGLTESTKSQPTKANQEKSLTGNRLEIPKINVKAPIIFDVPGTDEKLYLKKIENGVAQMFGSAKPNENGNVFIFGHSDYYNWKPGNYKEVFKKLDQLKVDDEFSIFYQDKEYKYKVIGNKNVKPDDWTIFDGPTPDNKNDKTITIMTCWPPGTLDFRKAVYAEQI